MDPIELESKFYKDKGPDKGTNWAPKVKDMQELKWRYKGFGSANDNEANRTGYIEIDRDGETFCIYCKSVY